jgi:hypothetical protein
MNADCGLRIADSDDGRRRAGRNGAAPIPPSAFRNHAIQLPLIPEDELRAAGNGRDRVPELTHYRDEGCTYWHACLTCPFPRCVFEEPGGPTRALRTWRDREIRRRFARGEAVPAIARHFGLTRRSVYRIVKGSGQWAMGSGETTEPTTAHCPLPTARRPKGGSHV